MVKEKFILETEITASEDGQKTFEIKRIWNKTAKKAIVITLYPTLSVDRCGEFDLSTMHLLNHVGDFLWGSIRILNLYSTVYESKPLVSSLCYDKENISYINSVLSSKDIGEYDIVIATGSSLKSHQNTIQTKIDILTMIIDKGLSNQVLHIIPEYIDTDNMQGIHPLYLGLHHGKEKWSLEAYDINSALEELNSVLRISDTKKPQTIEKKGRKKKCTTESKT